MLLVWATKGALKSIVCNEFNKKWAQNYKHFSTTKNEYALSVI